MSEDLFFEGKRYISVKRVSEISGYTQDYVGQLCREKKLQARQVGRVWYVSADSINSYQQKNNPKSEEQTIPKLAESVTALAASSPENAYLVHPRFSKKETKIKYEKDDRPLLPDLGKDPVTITFKRHLSSHRLNLAPALALLGLFVMTSVLWLQVLAPGSTKILREGVVATFKHETNQLALTQSATHAVVPNQTAQTQSIDTGLVVFPDPKNHDKAVSAVQNAFSDDTSVTYDSSGDSGVITPKFRDGDSTQNYAFVMVPLKTKK